uniref:AlNc14C28G2732 protein n=2 Tax=Albugo laibachii Nc14 TaxID=890382 RepID=F0W7B0_9STRA|nr:AlNc14C28G2732 [Albugo laibachii Nc14]|eukprot:CCA17009.1 AlNc14C28G2732 [Albugo laibachii Nc14]
MQMGRSLNVVISGHVPGCRCEATLSSLHRFCFANSTVQLRHMGRDAKHEFSEVEAFTTANSVVASVFNISRTSALKNWTSGGLSDNPCESRIKIFPQIRHDYFILQIQFIELRLKRKFMEFQGLVPHATIDTLQGTNIISITASSGRAQ